MRVQFCGANRTVTGSCHLVEANGTRVFLDMGMFQGPREQARQFNQWLPDAAVSADAVILSHGHLDHCGKLPVLSRAGYAGPIYCTPATAEVARIVLEDAGEIQEEDAAYLNRRARDPREPPVQPLFGRADAQGVVELLRPVPYGQKIDLKGLSFTFFDAGHILGSAYVLIEYREENQSRRLLFTADIGRYDTPIIRDPVPLEGPVDLVITESTYGDRRHAPMSQVELQLLAAVRSCVEHRSRLLVPSFAVGRTQTVLYYIQKFIHEKLIPPIPIYIDSPMGVSVTRVYSDFRESYDEHTNALIGTGDLFGLSRVTFASSRQQSREINADRGPCVIIASSATCEFGRVLHHLAQSIERPEDLIVFVGWTPPNTLGRRLQQRQRRVRIFDRWFDLRCRVETIHGLSAHADAEDMLKFLRPTLHTRTRAYVVHGDVDQGEGFGRRLIEAGIGAVVVPALQTSSIER